MTRTKKYDGIEEILKKKNILEDANLKKLKTYDGYINSSGIDIYKYEVNGEKRYCAELSYQTAIDDYNLEFDFKFKGLEPMFTCWECGRKTHWLETEGDLKEKQSHLEEKYCGC